MYRIAFDGQWFFVVGAHLCLARCSTRDFCKADLGRRAALRRQDRVAGAINQAEFETLCRWVGEDNEPFAIEVHLKVGQADV